LITIKKVVREPGERAKVSVESYDDRIDPVGACVGMKGSRIHSIVRELQNENIDVINFTDNLELYISRALSPAKILSMKIDEPQKRVSVYLKPDQVSLAIGKGGQNIKLASKLTGWNLNVMSLTDADELQAKEVQETGEKLGDKLGVDAEVAGVLIDEGYTSLDEIAEAEADVLSEIEEFDTEMVGELQERAQDAQLVKALNDAEATEILLALEGVDESLATALVGAEILTIEALAELAIVELLEIQDIGNDNASAVIMAARENEGWFE
jgi:N utilization substance protein A